MTIWAWPARCFPAAPTRPGPDRCWCVGWQTHATPSRRRSWWWSTRAAPRQPPWPTCTCRVCRAPTSRGGVVCCTGCCGQAGPTPLAGARQPPPVLPGPAPGQPARHRWPVSLGQWLTVEALFGLGPTRPGVMHHADARPGAGGRASGQPPGLQLPRYSRSGHRWRACPPRGQCCKAPEETTASTAIAATVGLRHAMRDVHSHAAPAGGGHAARRARTGSWGHFVCRAGALGRFGPKLANS